MTFNDFYNDYVKSYLHINDLTLAETIDSYGLIIYKSDYINKLVVVNMIYKFINNIEKTRLIYINDDYDKMYEFALSILDNIYDIDIKTFSMKHKIHPFKSIIKSNLSQLKFYNFFSNIVEEFDEGYIYSYNNLKLMLPVYFNNCRTGNVTICSDNERLSYLFPVDLMSCYIEKDNSSGFTTHKQNNPIKINTLI